MIYLILLLALGLRLVLANQSFWLDEAASIVIAKQDLPALFSSLQADFHPPFFYVLLHYWLKLGNFQEWFLRLPNILSGVVGIYLSYLLLLELKVSQKISLAAAFLLALNPFHIYYSQELRMYSLNATLAVLSWLLLLKSKTQKKSFAFYFFWVIVSLVNLFTYYGTIFNLFAQFAYLIAYQRKTALKTITSCLFALGVSFFFWLPTFLVQLKGGNFLVNALVGWKNLSGPLTLKSLLLIPIKFSLGRINLSTNSLYFLAGISITFYFFSLILISLKEKRMRPLALWLFLPLILAAFASIFSPMLGYWRYLFVLSPFIAMLAGGIFSFPKPLAYLNLFTVSLTFLLANLLFWFTPNFQREQWRQAVGYVQSQPSAITIFAFSDAFAPVRWYSPNLNYSAPLRNLMSDPEELDLTLSQATNNQSKVLYFEYLSQLTDPHANITTWLNNAGFIITSVKDFPGVGFVYEYQNPL